MARIDDLLYVDDLTKHSDQLSSISKLGVISHKNSPLHFSVPISGTPYKTPFATPSFSPGASPAKGERSPFFSGTKIPQRGFGVKKVLTDYLSVETRGGKEFSNKTEKPEPVTNPNFEKQGARYREGSASTPKQGSVAEE